jgi:hypothetical protein
MNFNPRIVPSPDQSPWEGTVRLVSRISRECRALHPDFRLSFETTWDRMLSYGAATWWAGNMSTARKIFPELVETVGLYQPYDYIGVNNAVRNGHAVMISPYHFNRSMDCEPWRGLAAYIHEVKKVRDALADYVFVGEQLDPSELALDRKQIPAGVDYAVYRNLKNRKHACVITNRGPAPAEVSLKGFGNDHAGSVRVFHPGQEPRACDLPTRLVLEPERLVFVVEN